MEPLLDKLARQPAVRNFFGRVRAWDKGSDDWILAMRPQLRMAVVCMIVPISFLALLTAIVEGPAIAILMLFLFYALGYVFALPNLFLIVCLRQGWRFRLVNGGIFLAYIAPITALSFSSKLSDIFGLMAFFLPPVAFIHFVYLTFAWQKHRPDRAWKIMKFTGALLIMAVICSTVWDNFVAGKIYNDSDDDLFGFFSPGAWVSNWDGQHPVVSVDRIAPESSMGDPDEIKKGWSVAGLWGLWSSLVGVSVMISIALAWLPWVPGRLRRVGG
jgi:hypothetical protein